MERFIAACDEALQFFTSKEVQRLRWKVVPSLTGQYYVLTGRLKELVETAVELPVDDEPPVSTDEVRALKDSSTAIVLVKRLKKWAISLLPAAVPDGKVAEPKGKGGRPKAGSKPSTNALLIDLFNDRPECHSWSSRKLMKPTGRSRASIEGAAAYKAAEELRLSTTAERKLRMAKRNRK